MCVKGRRWTFAALFVGALLFSSIQAHAQVLNCPKGWLVKRHSSGGITIYNPNRVESVKFQPLTGMSGNALQQLHKIYTEVKRLHPDVRFFNVKADQHGEMAECDTVLTGLGYHNDKTKLREKLFLLTKDGRTLLVLLLARADLYPSVARTLYLIANSAFVARTPQKKFTALNGPKIDMGNVSFRKVNTGVYYINVPASWSVMLASRGNLLATNARNETIFVFSLQVPADQETYEYEADGYRMLGKSPAFLALLARAVSPCLSPVEVVRDWYPRVTGGYVRDMRILNYRPMPPNSAAGRGTQQGVVKYSYTLNTRRSQTQMEGAAIVITTPPQIETPGATFWNLIAYGAEAPATVFSQRLPLYLAVFKSVRANLQGIRQQMANDEKDRNIIVHGAMRSIGDIAARRKMIENTFNSVNRMQRQEFNTINNDNYHVALGWMEAYGRQTPVVDVNTGAKYTLPTGYVSIFTSRGRNVRAPSGVDPILFNSLPGDVVKPVPLGSW